MSYATIEMPVVRLAALLKQCRDDVYVLTETDMISEEIEVIFDDCSE